MPQPSHYIHFTHSVFGEQKLEIPILYQVITSNWWFVLTSQAVGVSKCDFFASDLCRPLQWRENG